jgi:hypothetical protein
MTYAELPGGGAVFAVGSITFCGSLSHNGYHNNVSRILRNVLDRFRTRQAGTPSVPVSPARYPIETGTLAKHGAGGQSA